MDIISAKQYMQVVQSAEHSSVDRSHGLPGTKNLEFGAVAPVSDARVRKNSDD